MESEEPEIKPKQASKRDKTWKELLVKTEIFSDRNIFRFSGGSENLFKRIGLIKII